MFSASEDSMTAMQQAYYNISERIIFDNFSKINDI